MDSTATVRSNLATLVILKGEREGEKVTIAEIARETGIALNTVKKYLRAEHTHFDGRVVAALCKYLGCRLEDLLEIADVGESEDAKD